MGDHLMRRGDYSEALREYRAAESKNPNDPEILWRVGAALTGVALYQVGSARHDSLELATNYLNRAIVANSSIIEAHLEYARALGHLALFKPDWDDVRVARRVHEELCLVLREEPENPDANYLMGMWHRWVSPKPLLERKPNGLGEASTDSSLYYFRRATKFDDDNLEYRFELGLAYIRTGNAPAGKEILNRLIDIEDIPTRYADIPERAEEILGNLEKTDEEE